MLNIKFSKKGFTLIELIITLGIFSLVLFIMWYFYLNYYQVFNFQRATGLAAGSASLAANELQNAALQADKIINTYTISGNVYNTDQDTLILEMPSIDASGNIISGQYDYIVFYSDGVNLYRQLEASAGSVRASGIKGLSNSLFNLVFTYNNGDLSQANKINIDMQMRATIGQQTASYNLKEEIYLRNF